MLALMGVFAAGYLICVLLLLRIARKEGSVGVTPNQKCYQCGKEGVEVCQDGYCRDCHVSIDFDDCTSGTDSARRLLASGHPIEEVRRLYPNADLPEAREPA